MASMKRPRLGAVLPLAQFRLRLTFVDGSVFTVDFKPLFEESHAKHFTPAQELVISDLETLKVLADPLRLSILE